MKIIKKIIHKSKVLEWLACFGLSLFYIGRAYFIFRKIKPTPATRQQTVIITTILTFPITNLVYFDAIFGHAFQRAGATVKILFHDGVLPSYEGGTIRRNISAYQNISNWLKTPLKKALRITTLSYKDFLSDGDIDQLKKEIDDLSPDDYVDYQISGIAVGAQARASAIRYLLTGNVDLADPKHQQIFKEKLFGAAINATVATRLINREKPDMMFISHGLYSTWGPFLEACQKNQVEAVIHNQTAFHFGAYNFARNQTEFTIVSKGSWDQFKAHPLTAEQNQEIEQYLQKRITGSICDQKMFQQNYNYQTKKNTLLAKIFNPSRPFARTYALYPGLAWDAVLFEREAAFFENLFAWIDATIKFFQSNLNLQLVIKPHPAELVWEPGTKSIYTYIQEKFAGQLTDNITVLPPDTPLNAYDLVTQKNVIGITYNGTIGLEMASQGLPVIVVGHSHYTDTDQVVYQIKDIDHYLRTITDPAELIDYAQRNVNRARQYAYFYFLKIPIQIPFFDLRKWAIIDWSKVKKINQLLAPDGPMGRLAKKMLNHEDIINPI